MADGEKVETYWAALRKEAWEQSRQHFAWTWPVVIGVFTLVFTALVRGTKQAAVDTVSAVITAMATLTTAVIVYTFNIVKAAERLHTRQQTKMDVYRRSLEGVTNENAVLRGRLEARAANQALADALTEQYHYGLHKVFLGTDSESTRYTPRRLGVNGSKLKRHGRKAFAIYLKGTGATRRSSRTFGTSTPSVSGPFTDVL